MNADHGKDSISRKDAESAKKPGDRNNEWHESHEWENQGKESNEW